jgi:hypothetical protein
LHQQQITQKEQLRENHFKSGYRKQRENLQTLPDRQKKRKKEKKKERNILQKVL